MSNKLVSYPNIKTRKPKERIKYRHRFANPKISLSGNEEFYRRWDLIFDRDKKDE